MASARRQAEGSLIYIIDKSDLYLRVRDGLRQVMVQYSSLLFYFWKCERFEFHHIAQDRLYNCRPHQRAVIQVRL